MFLDDLESRSLVVGHLDGAVVMSLTIGRHSGDLWDHVGNRDRLARLVPKPFGVREELIDHAWEAASDVANGPVLASKPAEQKSDAQLHFRGRSFTGRM